MNNKHEFPYQVGKMVYQTIEEAKERAEYAHKMYPNMAINIRDRRNDTVVHSYPFGVK